MRYPDNSPARQFELIEWDKPKNKYKPAKIVTMTESQARDLNIGLAFNDQNKRYIMMK